MYNVSDIDVHFLEQFTSSEYPVIYRFDARTEILGSFYQMLVDYIVIQHQIKRIAPSKVVLNHIDVTGIVDRKAQVAIRKMLKLQDSPVVKEPMNG